MEELMGEYLEYASLGVALACGLVIGLDRERKRNEVEGPAEPGFGGIRTYPLVSLVGGMAQLSSQVLGPWIVGLAFVSFAAWVAIHYYIDAKRGHPGMTSEVAALACFFCGVLAAQEQFGLAFAVAISVSVVLSLKETLHRLVLALSREDVLATLKFLVVAFVVLPLLPSAPFKIMIPSELISRWFARPDLEVELINPSRVGWLVVLIAGISYAGFVASKLMKARRGLGLTAFLGGLASSTAVTLSFAGRAKEQPNLRNTCVVAILVASTTMFVRIMVEVAAVAPHLLNKVATPIGSMALAGILVCLLFWFRMGKSGDSREVELKNPFRLGQALKFGALFAVVLLVANVTEALFGARGLYVSGILAGSTDVDAITLTVAEMAASKTQPLATDQAVVAITLAAISNTAVKGVMALVTGGRELGIRVLAGFATIILVGAVSLVF